MKKSIIIFILSVIVVMSSCNARHDGRISEALYLTEKDKPDSAQSLLSKIDQTRLSDHDMAKYSLVYTIAQDKCGLNIDSDSLLGTAYTYYNKRPDDSLYAKCQYYMGKYYSLNDSSEKALICFQKSIASAKKMHDWNTLGMSLLQQSIILRDYSPQKAIACAKAAVSTYNNVKDAKPSNKAYYLLNLAECISYMNGTSESCIPLAKEAITYAMLSKDSTTISNSYQDLASFYGLAGKYSLALKASIVSDVYDPQKDFSKDFALSQFYVLTDSLGHAKSILSKACPLSLGDSSLLFSLKRTIAIKERNWLSAETFGDSTDFYLDRRNSENLKARNEYYTLMLQREVARSKVASESQRKTYLIVLISITSLGIIAFIGFDFCQRREYMQEKMEDKERMHQIEVEHNERQLTTMRNFLLSRADTIKKLKTIEPKELIKLKLTENDWKEIEVVLNSTDDEFVDRLKAEFADLTQKDIRFLMLVRLKIPYEGIASIYSIQEKSVKQRLFLFKNKLGLDDSRISTREFIESY